MKDKKAELKKIMIDTIIEICEDFTKIQNSKISKDRSFLRLPIAEQFLIMARELKVESEKSRMDDCIICLDKALLDEFGVCEKCLMDFKECAKKK